MSATLSAKTVSRVWLVANAGSGSTTTALVEALRTGLAKAGATLAGETDFPAEPLPDAANLDDAGVDTLVICAGDGTINAAWAAADGWDGQCLVLPGGTMNGLAKALHGDAGWEQILSRIEGAPLTHPPLATAQGHCALVGVILGPAAAWVNAREGVRKGRMARAVRAARHAWARTFTRSVRVAGSLTKHRAVMVTPSSDGLEIATFSADGVADAVRIGWQWLLGDWRAAPGVTCIDAAEVTLRGRPHVRALFDGEPATLTSPACVKSGKTRLPFLKTLPETTAEGVA